MTNLLGLQDVVRAKRKRDIQNEALLTDWSAVLPCWQYSL